MKKIMTQDKVVVNIIEVDNENFTIDGYEIYDADDTNEIGDIVKLDGGNYIFIKKPPMIEGKEIKLIENELGELEYIYIDNPLTIEQELELKLAQNTVETLELISALNEMQKLEQAQSNAELIELMMSLQGGM